LTFNFFFKFNFSWWCS